MFRRLLYANFRLVYRVSRLLRHRLTPAGALVSGGMIFSGIFGIDTRQTLAFQIFALAAALLLVAVFCMLLLRGRFQLRRELPDYGTVGQALRYKLYIRAAGRSRHRELLLYDELQEQLPDYATFRASAEPRDDGRNWFDRAVGYPRLMDMIQSSRGGTIEPEELSSLSPSQAAAVQLTLRPERRGYLHFSASRVARSEPLGLVRAIRTQVNPDSLLILPRLYRVPVISLPGSRKYQHGGLNAASTVGDSQEFMSLRDYRPGDPMRTIHWRSYAKTGHPVVKEFQDEFIIRQGLLLDTFLEQRPRQLFEAAVSLAASFTASGSFQGQDALLDLMLVGTQAYRISSGRGLGSLTGILEVLSCAEPCTEHGFDALEQLALQHAAGTSAMICVLLNWNEPRQRLVQLLANCGVPVCVFVFTAQQENLDPGPLRDHPDRFHVLRPERLQEQLDLVAVPAA